MSALASAIDTHPELWAAMVTARKRHKAQPRDRVAAACSRTFVEALCLVGRFDAAEVLARLDQDAAR